MSQIKRGGETAVSQTAALQSTGSSVRRPDQGATGGWSVAFQAEAGRVFSSRIPAWKRGLDLTCIVFFLPLWLAAMGLVALWIIIVSPGALVYRQERVGYHGKRFTILKFRSMKTNAETDSHERYFAWLVGADCPMKKLDDGGDLRLIPGGRLLRAIGLDELPQIFNVIRGEMSLVGPRPCTPREYEQFKLEQRVRVEAPPGVTGYWQVNGKNETTFAAMIEMDLYYVKNMSLLLDLEILLRTFPAIASQAAGLRSRFLKNNEAVGLRAEKTFKKE